MERTGEFVQEHPTGIGTQVAAAAVLLIDKFSDVDFTATESVLIVAAIAGVLSLLSPRFRAN